MPKKLSTNPKAEAARERKETKKREEKERADRAKEDAYWKDEHQDAARKQQRKDDKEQKRLTQLQRKKEAQALLEEEEAKLSGKPKQKGPAPKKVTRAQIEVQKQKEEQIRKSAEKERQKEDELSNDFMGENPNQAMAEILRNEGVAEARTIEDAITVLKLKEDDSSSVDKHPEKRMKAAYAAFEEENLPRLKEENPNLRLSQLKQMLRKEWMKSPSNPMNQRS